MKLAKMTRKSSQNSTCLYSVSFELNTGKSQGGRIDSVGCYRKKFKVCIIQHESENQQKER